MAQSIAASVSNRGIYLSISLNASEQRLIASLTAPESLLSKLLARETNSKWQRTSEAGDLSHSIEHWEENSMLQRSSNDIDQMLRGAGLLTEVEPFLLDNDYELLGLTWIPENPSHTYMYTFLPLVWSFDLPLQVEEHHQQLVVLNVIEYGGDSWMSCIVTLGACRKLGKSIQKCLPWVHLMGEQGHSVMLWRSFRKPNQVSLQSLLSLVTSFGYKLVTATTKTDGKNSCRDCNGRGYVMLDEYIFALTGDAADTQAIHALREEFRIQSKQQASLVAEQAAELSKYASDKESLQAELAALSESDACLKAQLANSNRECVEMASRVTTLQSKLNHQEKYIELIDSEICELRKAMEVREHELKNHQESSAATLAEAKEVHAREVEQLHARVRDQTEEAITARHSPKVSIRDVDGSSRQIRIECPGVDEDAIGIDRLPNGVRVCFDGDEESRRFVQEFNYDYNTEGFFTLREDEVSLEYGVLLVVLERSPPQRMKLRRPVTPSSSATLMPLSEERQWQSDCTVPPLSECAGGTGQNEDVSVSECPGGTGQPTDASISETLQFPGGTVRNEDASCAGSAGRHEDALSIATESSAWTGWLRRHPVPGGGSVVSHSSK